MSDKKTVAQNPESTQITVHDYTCQVWGHALRVVTPTAEDGKAFNVLGFNQKRVNVGDLFVIGRKGKSSSCYRVVKIEFKSDPRDMFEADIEYVPGVNCNACGTWFDATDERIQAGTCPVCESGK